MDGEATLVKFCTVSLMEKELGKATTEGIPTRAIGKKENSMEKVVWHFTTEKGGKVNSSLGPGMEEALSTMTMVLYATTSIKMVKRFLKKM